MRDFKGLTVEKIVAAVQWGKVFTADDGRWLDDWNRAEARKHVQTMLDFIEQSRQEAMRMSRRG